MKVAICGAGDMATVHFDAFAGIEGLEVIALSDPDASRLEDFAGRGVDLFASSEEMIDGAGADIVTIATPTRFHAPLAIHALDRGMHVFCEKPMARTTAEGEAMARAAKKSGKTLAIGYSLRSNPVYRLAREHVSAGKLGEIGTIRTSRCARPDAAWTTDVAANGGAVFELLTHDLDWIEWTFGPVRRTFARGIEGAPGRDYVLAVLRLSSGAIAHLEGSLAEPGDFHASFEIAGTGGLLAYDTRKAGVLETKLVADGALSVRSRAPSSESAFVRQARAFVNALREGREYDISPDEALGALRLAEATLRSIETGRPVEIA